MTDNYKGDIVEIVLHGKLFSDRFDGSKIKNVKEDHISGRIEILFKDGSTIIHKGSYTIDLKNIESVPL